MVRAFAACCLIGTLAIEPGASAARDQDAFNFFRPDVELDARQRERLERDEVVVQVLETDDDEIAVFAATKIDADGDSLASWTRAIAELKRSTVVLAIRRFSSPPSLDDLNGLGLDEAELQSIRRCHPDDCSVKLLNWEIEALQGAGAGAGDLWRTAMQHAFKQVVLARLYAYPVEADDDSFLYWSKEQYGMGKPVISVTHVSITRPARAGEPEVVVLAREVYATHYRRSSLGITAIIYDPKLDQRYLTYVNRSRVDLLTGLFGGLKRKLIEGRLRTDTAGFVAVTRRRLESGPPPGRPDS